MTLVASPYVTMPNIPDGIQGVPAIQTAISTLLMDASGEKLALVTAATKTGAVHKIHVRIGTVTTPTDTDIRVESVDASGNPSGSLLGVNTNATLAAGSITTGAWVTVTLTADASVSQGDIFAVVVAPTGTPNYNLSTIGNLGTPSNFPYCKQYTTSWFVSGNPYLIFVEYADGTFLPSVTRFSGIPATTINSHALTTAATPDEVALKFTIDTPCQVVGCWSIITPGAGDEFQFQLYSSDGSTVLASSVIDGDQTLQQTGRTGVWRFSSSVTLAAGTYYLSMLVTGAGDTVTVYSYDVNSAALLEVTGTSSAWHYAERTDAGSWTPTTTRRPFMGLVIDQIDDGTGSGSGSGIGLGIPTHGTVA